MYLGGRLRKLRRQRGLTLALVSSACGLSITHLSEVELERRPPPRPSHPAYEPLATTLGVAPARLRRAAARDRLTLVEGIPWMKRRTS